MPDIKQRGMVKIMVMSVLSKIKPGVPKRMLFFVAALAWGFAADRVLNIGASDIADNTDSYYIYIIIGLIGFYFFFKRVIFKAYFKYAKRIINLKHERPCVFSFFNLKGFMVMAIMIFTGITLRKIEYIPPLYIGTFYITVGASLLLASLCFLYSGIKYEQFKNKYYVNGH